MKKVSKKFCHVKNYSFLCKVINNEKQKIMKTEIKYSVSNGLMTFKTWKNAVEFANKIGVSTIVVNGKRGSKECELGYKVDTWKNAKQIAFDVECELI